MRLLSSVSIVALMLVATAAQVRDRAQPPSPTGSDAATMAEGWTALAAGRRDAASAAAGRVLARTPWNHSAIALRIEALSSPEPMEGLAAYERWLGQRTVEDAGLLAPVAREVLLKIASEGEADLRHEAARQLTAAGVTPPAGDPPDLADQLAVNAERASRGDAAALEQLARAASAGTVDPSLMAGALESAGPAATPVLVSMLQGSAGPGRAAAAAALGRRHAEEARPALQALANDPDPFVRSTAAVALARMGDREGQAFVERMLQSPVPDIRLMAAEAWNGQDGPWVTAIMPLLENKDGTIRLQAARLIAPVNPDLARRTLNQAAGDGNPVIRAEAAKAMGRLAPDVPQATDLKELRRLLRDRDPSVRLHAAGTLLAVVR